MSAGAARRRRGGRGTVVLLLLLLTGCGVDDEAVEARRERLAERARTAIAQDLGDALARASRAAAAVDEALRRSGGTAAARFPALEQVRRAHRVDGLLWEGPGGDTAWAGRPIEPRQPPPAPWAGSFRAGTVAYHHGPFLRGVVLGPLPAQGGYVSVSVELEEQAPETVAPPYEGRWLEPLGIAAARILPPERAREGDVEVPGPGGEPALAVRVEVPGPQAVRDRLAQQEDVGRGALLLAGWFALLALVALFLRRRTRGPARWLLAAAAALGMRALLGPIDMSRRFPPFRQAFDPVDFGIADPLGWMASPGDLALTMLAALVAAACFSAAARASRVPRGALGRSVAVLVGSGAAAAVAVLWADVVAVAVAQSRTIFFQSPSFLPSIPSALMLLALVAGTAAAWLTALASARLAVAALPLPRLAGAPLVAAVAAVAAAAAWHPAAPLLAPALLPLSALPVLLRAPDGTAGGPASSRVLLVGVLATALLFPLLWARVEARRGTGLEVVLDNLLREQATSPSAVRQDLEALVEDPWVRDALAEARRGPLPEGLALHIWQRSLLALPGEHGIVSVLDGDGRRLDEFTLTPLPRARLPGPTLPTEDAGDLQVVTLRGEAGRVRSVVGRLRLRDEDGEALGTIVLTVPDRIDLALLGLAEVTAPEAAGRSLVDPLDVQLALLRGGRVVASSDPAVSRRRGGFGPARLAELDGSREVMTWQEEGAEGRAAWSDERGAVVAVRRPRRDGGDAVVALSRLVVVGVGVSAAVAIVVFVLLLGRFRPRLHHRILLSYFAISFLPILVLGWTTAREVRSRHDAYLAERLETDIRRARNDLEAMGAHVFDQASMSNLVLWATQFRHDVMLYRDGEVVEASRPGLVEAELLPSRLPPDAYRATVIEHRELVRREASFAGRPVWFGYAPILDASGATVATIGVPLLYDKERVDEQLAMAGSVLFGAYLLTLVFVLVGGLWAARRLTRPLDVLAAGTRRVAAGELDVALPGGGDDELGELVRAFNAMTEELRETTARAVRAEREMAWRRMARQVAHEIKNPLTPMRLMLQQLQAVVERDPARAREAIARTAPVVLRQIETLGRIAGDFAAFARLPRRAMAPLDVAVLVAEVVELYSGHATDGIDVVADVADDVPPLTWDEGEMRRVLVNLVGNAVQAIEGAGRVVVRGRGATRDGTPGVLIEVEDDGAGIPAEHRDRLFEPAFSTKTSGTGLGLAIVRRTLDDMGGTITVESEVGRGTTFRLWCPSRPPPEVAAPSTSMG